VNEAAKLVQYVQRTFREMMLDIGITVPGYLLAFDPDTQLAQVQIGVEGVNKDGETYNPPALIECPVYVYGGAYCVEVELVPETEGIILFSQRCIEGWKQTGGVAKETIARFNDFSDCYFLPGLRSQAGKITGHQNNGIRLRNADGSNYIWLKNDGTGAIKLTSFEVDAATTFKGTATFENDVTMQKSLDVTEDITADGTVHGETDVTGGAADISLTAHTHAVTTAPGTTGAPNT